MTDTKLATVSEALPTRSEPSFADQMQLAATLLKTGFLPKGLDTPGKVLAVILTGREMGLGPMTATRSIGVINGRPVLAADLQLALFKRAGGQAKWVLNTDTEAKLWLKHQNGDEHTQSFTMEDAKRAGLTARGDTYHKYPQAMLRARAITAALKAIGFEPTAGIYDPDELEPLKISGPPVEESPAPLNQPPKALTEPVERLPFDGRPDENGEEMGDPVPEAEQLRVFMICKKAGVTKTDFPAFYEQVCKRAWPGSVRVEDVGRLEAAAKARSAP